ncbi:MAG TPA: hypothetical protein VJK02_00550 [Anaerolineales bacterium]|jgi:hypothetical protein|nr:hypothetical protein [Anaerolineales bacterium]
MPALTRWYIKTSLLYLIVALVIGGLLAGRSALGLPSEIGALSPVFFHLFMVGWVSELIFGVVYWMFPKMSRENPRGNAQVAWGTYVALNVGLLLRAVGEPMASLTGSTGWGVALALSAFLQWIAGMAFVVSTWPRVKER